MNYSKPFHIYKRVFENCPITENVYFLGKRILNSEQKLIGQSSPNNFLDSYKVTPKTNSGSPDVDLIIKRIKSGFKEFTGKNGEITESWAQYYKSNIVSDEFYYTQNRKEKPKMYSGGYYLHDGESLTDHGTLTFHVQDSKHYIRPQKGMLLIWPHDIIHSVEPFYGRVDRAVINFNIQA